MLYFEVLIREFFAVDGFSTSAAVILTPVSDGLLLVTGEISSLKHEFRNHTVEGAASISLWMSQDSFQMFVT